MKRHAPLCYRNVREEKVGRKRRCLVAQGAEKGAGANVTISISSDPFVLLSLLFNNDNRAFAVQYDVLGG